MTTHTVTAERVSRQSEAQGAHCESCDQTFNITTVPYWHWSKSAAMHRSGTGHKVEYYRIIR